MVAYNDVRVFPSAREGAVPDIPLLPPGVFDAMMSHVRADPAAAAGGILIGRREGEHLIVTRAMADYASGDHLGEITFSQGIWHDVYASLGDDASHSKVLGWYHSHPSSELRMSEYDRALHTAMFGDPSMVALVIDPIAEKSAWYGWDIRGLLEP